MYCPRLCVLLLILRLVTILAQKNDDLDTLFCFPRLRRCGGDMQPVLFCSSPHVCRVIMRDVGEKVTMCEASRARRRSLFRHQDMGEVRMQRANVGWLERRTDKNGCTRKRVFSVAGADSEQSNSLRDGAIDTRVPRMYIGDSYCGLYPGQMLELSENKSHYIVNVMRLRDGDLVRIFDGVNGEFIATVCRVTGKGVARRGRGKRHSDRGSGARGTTDVERETKPALRVERLVRRQSRGILAHEQEANTPEIEVIFAPIRKQRLKMLVEKAVEIGASRLTPVLTARTQKSCSEDAANALGKLSLTAVEAAEQCERMTVPEVELAPVTLTSLLQGWQDAHSNRRHTGDVSTAAADGTLTAKTLDATTDRNAIIFVCKERDAAPPLLNMLEAEFAGRSERRNQGLGLMHDDVGGGNSKSRIAFLVGPEGGFAPEEIQAMANCPFVRFVSLGPTVLRAETATMYALACWSAFWIAKVSRSQYAREGTCSMGHVEDGEPAEDV